MMLMRYMKTQYPKYFPIILLSALLERINTRITNVCASTYATLARDDFISRYKS